MRGVFSAALESSLRFLSWLGGLDSNQGSMRQRHVSYRWTTSQKNLAIGRSGHRVICNPVRPTLKRENQLLSPLPNGSMNK
jgi:hypothetical protein